MFVIHHPTIFISSTKEHYQQQQHQQKDGKANTAHARRSSHATWVRRQWNKQLPGGNEQTRNKHAQHAPEMTTECERTHTREREHTAHGDVPWEAQATTKDTLIHTGILWSVQYKIIYERSNWWTNAPPDAWWTSNCSPTRERPCDHVLKVIQEATAQAWQATQGESYLAYTITTVHKAISSSSYLFGSHSSWNDFVEPAKNEEPQEQCQYFCSHKQQQGTT